MIALNRRRVMGGGGGSPLPYDAEVEYLQGYGSAYIDLGMPINSATDSITIEFKLSSFHTDGRGMFGARNAANSLNYACGLSGTPFLYVDCNNSNYSTYRTTYNVAKNTTYLYKISIDRNQSRSIYRNGSRVAVNQQVSDSFITDRNCFLFATNGVSLYIDMQLSFFQWERSGAILLDLIPVRIGQTGYLYNKVSGQLFGNAGSGAFILGPDKN